MTATEKHKVEILLDSVSSGVGDRCGCNDGDQHRAEVWKERFFGTRLGHGFNELVDDISEAVAYGD